MGSFTTDSTMRVTFFFVAVLAFFSIGSALRYNGGANCDSRNHEVMAEVPGCMKHSDFPSCGNHRGNTCSSSYTIKPAGVKPATTITQIENALPNVNAGEEA